VIQAAERDVVAERPMGSSESRGRAGGPLKVLFLSRSYPNSAMPLLGLWVEGLVRCVAKRCEVRVVSPVPYCPPLPGLNKTYTRFRRIPTSEIREEIAVLHPRFLLPPGYWYHGLESFTYYLAVVSRMDRLRREFDFDIIHGEFSFPDGWVAARLGQRYGVPVVITEHAPWRPWMDDYKLVRSQALWAARKCAFHIAVSRSVREEIAHFTGDSPGLRVIPNGVDTSLFTLPPTRRQRKLDQILFVGAVRPVKGLDVLLKALRLLKDNGRALKLLVIGDAFYRAYRAEYDRLRLMARELDLESQVDFVGGKTPDQLVPYMQESAMLVLPSRKESLGMVLVEAIACGTPVVATRCGGPEDIVNDKVGVLVPPDDPVALAAGISNIIDHPDSYNPEELRAYAVAKFSWERVTAEVVALYNEAIESSRRAKQLDTGFTQPNRFGGGVNETGS
jgi:teichuronic acid biosynthesis glycosyltransferase TuaC